VSRGREFEIKSEEGQRGGREKTRRRSRVDALLLTPLFLSSPTSRYRIDLRLLRRVLDDLRSCLMGLSVRGLLDALESDGNFDFDHVQL